MTDRLFVDTNVWVYAVDKSDVAKQSRAQGVLQPTQDTDLVISAQVLGEFLSVVTRKFARQVPTTEARAMVVQMSRLPVVPIDARLVEVAIAISQEWQLSYWDGLIIAAAETSGCGRVLSEDMLHGAVYGSVQVENPFLG
jgi:predicted nucleic acid-binding protein